MTSSFDFVDFPATAPSTQPIIGHDRLHRDRYHGGLTLQLTALTPVFSAAGVTALGADVGEPAVPLLKVMTQDVAGCPILQGTSLKGCIRAVYETITNSTFGVEKKIGWKSAEKMKAQEIEQLTREERILFDRAPRKAKNRILSPAELVFGAMGFQGLVSVADAMGDRPLELGELPAMFQPKHGNGRKFYRHQTTSTVPSIAAPPSPASPDEKSPIPIQQAPKGTVFDTTLRFTNLALPQLGALLIALGQDPKRPFALKVGGGKGKGFGSVRVTLTKHAITKGDRLAESRYLAYQSDPPILSDDILTEARQAACDRLIHQESLDRLKQILHHPEVTP
ncbi:MAG: RAMP superfamily CRISPR-associated protein [Cyanobacteria bacterium P01_A01_bin.17]